MSEPNITRLVPEQSIPFSITLNTLIGKICLYFLQLKERDACGNTPFMTAVQCHNFKAAIYILDFVESNKGIVQLHVITCKISFFKNRSTGEPPVSDHSKCRA